MKQAIVMLGLVLLLSGNPGMVAAQEDFYDGYDPHAATPVDWQSMNANGLGGVVGERIGGALGLEPEQTDWLVGYINDVIDRIPVLGDTHTAAMGMIRFGQGDVAGAGAMVGGAALGAGLHAAMRIGVTGALVKSVLQGLSFTPGAAMSVAGGPLTAPSSGLGTPPLAVRSGGTAAPEDR